ncbi:MAG: class I SAM-dependent methyltransferase [Deinococcales bacterium]|jgi:ubiquinone/menaquinone biosynthesis C-methylase UbiE
MAVRDAPTCSCAVEDRRIPAFLLDNLLRRLFQPPRRFVARYVRAGDRVADLGCGPGHFTVPMSKAVREGGRVFAVDFDPDAIGKVRRKIARLGLGHVVDARVASAAEIDFVEAGSLDFVLAEGLLCCMQDHAGALEQIRRILRPKGKAWLSVMKFGRPDDPRTVTASEWTSILNTMRVLESGESLLSRWALVSPSP